MFLVDSPIKVCVQIPQCYLHFKIVTVDSIEPFLLGTIQYYYNTRKQLKKLYELIPLFYQIVYNTVPLCYTSIVWLRYGITSVIFRRFS